jgi:hypothetical protein
MAKKQKPKLYSPAESKFLKDCVLPPLKDSEGIKKIADEFNQKFGTSRSPLAVYNKAAVLQGRWNLGKKAKRSRKAKEAAKPAAVPAKASRYLVRIDGQVVWEGDKKPDVSIFVSV